MILMLELFPDQGLCFLILFTYICIYKNQSEKNITDTFNQERKKIKDDVKITVIKSFTGESINKGIVCGMLKIITQNSVYKKIPKQAIIVTSITTPEMTLILKNAKALITDEGGLLCHAAIFAREYKVIAILSTKTATKVLKDGDLVEVNANSGVVWKS